MNKPQHIPDILLERYVLGELADKEMNRISTLAGENKQIQNRIKDIISSTREILIKYPPRRMAAQIQAGITDGQAGKKPEPTVLFFRPLILGGFAAVCTVLAAAILLLPLVLPGQTGITEPEKEITRLKGSDTQADRPLLTIFKKSGDQAQKLDDGSTVHTHDTIQLQYFAARDTFGIIFSIDGRGMVTLHFPGSREASTALTPDRKVLLPDSFELDDAPGFERFFFITSPSPVNTPEVLAAAERTAENLESARTGPLQLPGMYNQTSFILIKGD